MCARTLPAWGRWNRTPPNKSWGLPMSPETCLVWRAVLPHGIPRGVDPTTCQIGHVSIIFRRGSWAPAERVPRARAQGRGSRPALRGCVLVCAQCQSRGPVPRRLADAARWRMNVEVDPESNLDAGALPLYLLDVYKAAPHPPPGPLACPTTTLGERACTPRYAPY